MIRTSKQMHYKMIYLDFMKKFIIWNDGVIAVTATLESVVPPAGHKYIGGMRYVGPEHVSKYFHSFFQCVLVSLCFDTFWFPVGQRHHQYIRTRVRILHVLMTQQQVSTNFGFIWNNLITPFLCLSSTVLLCMFKIESTLITKENVLKRTEIMRSDNVFSKCHECSLKYVNPLLIFRS